MLKAGYLEDWQYHESLSGCPQGGVVSPILSNIYLNRLDEFVEQELIPQYTRGARRKDSPDYIKATTRLAVQPGRDPGGSPGPGTLPARNPQQGPEDPGYRRLKYTRYADDHILGYIGPKAEAEQIKARIAEFLRETLKLNSTMPRP